MSQVQVQRITTLSGHRDAIYALDGVEHSPIFFSGSGDGMIVQWKFGEEEGKQIAKMNSSIYALRHDPVSGYLLAGHNFEGLHLLDWRTGKEVGSIKLATAAIFDVAVFGNLAVVACGDGVVHVVDTRNMTLIKVLVASTKSARSISVNQATSEIAIGYSDNFIRIFRLDDFSLRMAIPAHENSVFCVRYSADGRWLLSGSRDARLKQWNVLEGYGLHKEVAAHLFAINDLRFSPDGKHFVTCSMDKSVKVWRTDDLTLLKVIDKARHAGHGTSVNKLLWSSFNNQIVSASDDRTISIWDVIF
jgi:WD40 repeat protein